MWIYFTLVKFIQHNSFPSYIAVENSLKYFQKDSHNVLSLSSQRIIAQQEEKNSGLKEELVATKEALNRALLDKEVLDQQRQETSELSSLSLNIHIELLPFV